MKRRGRGSDSRDEQTVNRFSIRQNLFDHLKPECTEENLYPRCYNIARLVQRYLRAAGDDSGLNKDLNGSPASPWAIICIGSRFGWSADGDASHPLGHDLIFTSPFSIFAICGHNLLGNTVPQKYKIKANPDHLKHYFNYNFTDTPPFIRNSFLISLTHLN